MAYDQSVIDAINDELNAANAPPLVRKAAFEAGLQESGLQNLDHGDRDSLGAFQQRPSQGWGTAAQVQNPRYAANKFVTAAMQAYKTGRYGNAGDLAQAVQRSAYPSYYAKHSAEADRILAGLGGGTSTSPRPSGSTPVAGGVSSTAPSAPDGGQGSDFTGLLSSLLGQQQHAQPVQGVLAPPAFASSALTPQGFHPIQQSVASAFPGQDALSSNLSLVAALGGQGAAGTTPTAPGTAQAPSGASTGIAARVRAQRAAGIRISPHARPGDPVVSSLQSQGGLHETEGLAGYPAHDYFAPAGTHAVAPVSGTVVKVSGHDPMMGPTEGPHGPFGYSTYIRGDDGKTYYLTHMGSRTVKVGQTVQQGQIIGTVGDYDKYGTPSHIHQGVSGG